MGPGRAVPFTSRNRPAWVRALNALGRVGPLLPRLDTETLLDAARRRTGLDDFGDEDFREPLEILCRALDAEAELTPLGRLLARHELGTLLESRLRVVDSLVRHPEIGKEEVRAPLFVTGSGRSGTSLLHELLAQDPQHRALLTWEALRPCPPPESDSRHTDPRIARADREVKLWEKIAPAYATMHQNGGGVPQECIYLTAQAFRSDLLSGFYRVPSYAAWLARCDMQPGYEHHRRVLRLLQWRCPSPRWVLKAPSHLWTLDALLAVYPDARVVWTHRDPLVVLPSMASLASTLYWLRSDRVEPPSIARQMARSIAFMLDKACAWRDAGLLPPERVFDLRYADLLRDPIGALRGLYGHFGMRLTAEAEVRMGAYLRARPRHRRGAHRYAFEDTGLDRESERRRFAAYQERFAVPSEL
jgi:hypothetical protein